MKAIVYRRYGAPEVLHVEKVPTPAPRENEILIRVHAAEATKSDCELRRFRFPVKWFWLPMRLMLGITGPRKTILGCYFSGVIEAVGSGVTRFQVGDAVYGSSQLRFGAYAHYLCLPERYTVVPKPDNISFEEAAAVPLGGLNALHFIRKADIQPGERVLINGAGGSIGTHAVQIAKAQGAHVTAVDSAIKEPMLRAIGADHFLDYSRDDFTANGPSYDVIFNMVAGLSFSRCLDALHPGGRYLVVNPRLSDMFRAARLSRSGDKTAVVAIAGETREELSRLSEMIAAGTLKPVVDRVYPMDQAARAHERVETEQRLGSIVISMDPGG